MLASVGWKPQRVVTRVASVRIRVLNTVALLRAQGFPVELYRPSRRRGYRVVVFSKSYQDEDIALASELQAGGAKVVFDLCDNHFLQEPERVARLRRMLSVADRWVVSSEALGELLRREAGEATPLSVIDDAVEESLEGNPLDLPGAWRAWRALRGLDRFLRAHPGALRLVWFGNHKGSHAGSGMERLAQMLPVIAAAAARGPLVLTVISNSRELFEELLAGQGVDVHYVEWSPHNFFDALRRHQVAVIPMEVNAFTRVKTNNRIALALNQGLGAIADGIPSYRVFEACAFLDRWEEGLAAFQQDPGLAARQGAAAQAIIRAQFAPALIAAKWRALFEELLATPR